MRRRMEAAVVLAMLVGLLAPTTQLPQARVEASTPGGAITWTVDHVKKTIDAVVRIQIYTACSGNPYGNEAQRASACNLPGSMIAGATQFLADKIKSQIEGVWNKAYRYKCYTLHFSVDVKLGTDLSHVDGDRIAVRIDPSPGDIRDFVSSESHDPTRWRSDDPADRLSPTNDNDNEATWGEESAIHQITTYAHEFGHLLGLHDGYRDVTDAQGRVTSERYPDAPNDLMSTMRKTISQETINRLVKRSLPLMKDTAGKPVTDKDFACDYEGSWSGQRIVGTVRYCGSTEKPYWGVEVSANNGDRGFVAYDIPFGSEAEVPVKIVTPFVEPEFTALMDGTGRFVAADPPNPQHFVITYGEGTYIITLKSGSLCAYPGQ